MKKKVFILLLCVAMLSAGCVKETTKESVVHYIPADIEYRQHTLQEYYPDNKVTFGGKVESHNVEIQYLQEQIDYLKAQLERLKCECRLSSRKWTSTSPIERITFGENYTGNTTFGSQIIIGYSGRICP